MHVEAYEWVSRYGTAEPIAVLDIGGRDINGTCRPLFPNAEYVVLDALPGENVDIVANAATWLPDRHFDVVVCTEVFEHTPDWPAICATAYAACTPGGRFIVTCAGPGRHTHSAIVEGPLQPGEYYQNLDPVDLRRRLDVGGWNEVHVDRLRRDLRATAVR